MGKRELFRLKTRPAPQKTIPTRRRPGRKSPHAVPGKVRPTVSVGSIGKSMMIDAVVSKYSLCLAFTEWATFVVFRRCSNWDTGGGVDLKVGWIVVWGS
ncbi:hypothetical protein Tco_0271092 [Tanacetum coccineum]